MVLKGERKDQREVSLMMGRLKRMLMPVDMKGWVKSTTCSRSEVIVRSAAAISASSRRTSPTMPEIATKNSVKLFRIRISKKPRSSYHPKP